MAEPLAVALETFSSYSAPPDVLPIILQVRNDSAVLSQFLLLCSLHANKVDGVDGTGDAPPKGCAVFYVIHITGKKHDVFCLCTSCNIDCWVVIEGRLYFVAMGLPC